jgi:hypothetical protein
MCSICNMFNVDFCCTNLGFSVMAVFTMSCHSCVICAFEIKKWFIIIIIIIIIAPLLTSIQYRVPGFKPTTSWSWVFQQVLSNGKLSCSMENIQSNLCTTATLGTWKTWPLCRGLYEKDQWEVGFRVVVMPSDYPLLTGGRYSEVVVRTGLTVIQLMF